MLSKVERTPCTSPFIIPNCMEKLDTSPSHLKNNNHILYTEILTLKIELGIFHKTTFVQSKTSVYKKIYICTFSFS